jgi:hypothetical protein
MMVAMLAIAPLAVQAQDKNDKASDEKPLPNVLSWRPGILYSAAMQTFAVPNPISVAAVRVMAAADEQTAQLVFPEWDLVLDAPIPLSQRLLDLQQDDTAIPQKTKKVQQLNQRELAYWSLLDQALIDSKSVRSELFKKAAAENDYATYDHLFRQPQEWRGKVVPVEGRLLRVRKWRPSERAQQAGIEYVYEGFIAGQTPNRPPYWVLFTTLPEGLPVRETMSVPVTFYGYYIKRVVYPAEKVDRKTNLLIGPTVYLKERPAQTDEAPFSRDVLYMAVGGLVGLALVLAGLHLYFRRGDKAIQSRLAVLRDRQPLGIADDEQTSEPPASAAGGHSA